MKSKLNFSFFVGREKRLIDGVKSCPFNENQRFSISGWLVIGLASAPHIIQLFSLFIDWFVSSLIDE